MVKSSVYLNRINNRKIIKNLGQFASIIIITLLAVCLSVGLNSSAQTLEKKLDVLLEETNYADGTIYGLIGEEEINELKDYVDEYQQRLLVSSSINNINSNLLISNGKSSINTPYCNNYNGGVYITHELARNLNVEVGDTITLNVDLSMFFNELTSTILNILDLGVKEDKDNIFRNNIVKLDFTIDGLMYHSEGITEDNPISLEYSSFTESFIKVIDDNFNDSEIIIPLLPFISGEVYNSVLFKGDFDTVKDLTYFESDNYKVIDSKYNAGLMQMENDIEQAYQLTYVFPVIFILVSILIIITTISQLIFKERLNIATLKSIGITNKEVYLHYMLLTISLCLIGGVIGSLIGPMIIPSVMGIKYGLLYNVPNVSNVYPLGSIFSIVFLFIIISSLVSFGILRNSVNTLPAALIKNNATKNYKVSKIKISSWSLKIALRNISQNVFRSLMVIVGVGGCGALLITGFGIDDTLNNTVNLEMNRNFNANATITFDDYSIDLRSEILSLDGITDYEEYSIVSGSIDVDILNVTNIFIIDDNTKVFNKGDFNGITISSKVADNLELKINDDIIVKIGSDNYSYKIEYIIETGFTHGLFIPSSMIDEEFSVTNAWYNTLEQEKYDEIISNMDGVKDVATHIEFRKMTDDALGPISIIKLTLQIFALLLGVVVLYNLALLNYKERHRDIATLKVLGLTNVEISKSLMYEMMILAILGGIFGLVIGYPMLVLLLSINEVDFITYIYNLTPLSYILTFLFTTLTALIINLALFRQINNIKMVESLKSVE